MHIRSPLPRGSRNYFGELAFQDRLPPCHNTVLCMLRPKYLKQPFKTSAVSPRRPLRSTNFGPTTRVRIGEQGPPSSEPGDPLLSRPKARRPPRLGSLTSVSRHEEISAVRIPLATSEAVPLREDGRVGRCVRRPAPGAHSTGPVPTISSWVSPIPFPSSGSGCRPTLAPWRVGSAARRRGDRCRGP